MSRPPFPETPGQAPLEEVSGRRRTFDSLSDPGFRWFFIGDEEEVPLD